MGRGMAGEASVPLGAAVPSLVRWGLSCDADMVFRTITTFGPLSARALATELGLPARRVDAALAELRSNGAAVSVAGGPGAGRALVWVTRTPQDTVEMLRTRRLRRVDPRAQANAHNRAVPATLSHHAGPTGAPAGGMLGDRILGAEVRHLPSRSAARQRLAQLIAVECREHLSMNTEQAFDAASARVAAPLDRQLIQRGIRLRVIGLPPADQDPHVGTDLLDHPRCGYRETPEVPLKLVVVDRTVAFFPVDPNDFDRGYLEISQPGVVRALVMLFEQHWNSAVDPREQGMQPVALSDRERELVGLLARGHTDISAATQLRISARSVTKIMRGLMDRLGVENRFQLGLVLGAARAAAPGTAPPPASKES